MISFYASQLKFLRCLECMLLIYVENNRFHIASVLSPQRNKVLIYNLIIHHLKLRSGCKFPALFSKSTPIELGFEMPRCGKISALYKACNSGRFHYIIIVVFERVFFGCAYRCRRSSDYVRVCIVMYYLLALSTMGLVYNDEREFSAFGKVTALHRLNHRHKGHTFSTCPE